MKTYEILTDVLFAFSIVNIVLIFTHGTKVWYSVVAFLVGILFKLILKHLENQERIISLLEANPNEKEKENRTE